ncbi:MAG: LysR family transcriptional regulator, partial [Clostridia bacterium]
MNYSDFDLNLIKIFTAVAESGTISATSKKLYISQPAITNSIKKLESYLNGSLFVRTPRGMKLTPEGEQFYNFCKVSLDKLSQGFSVFAEYADLKQGEIKIGSSSTLIRHMLIPFLAAFGEKYPNVKITITDGVSGDLEKYLLKSDADLAFMSAPINTPEHWSSVKITSTTDFFIAGHKY